MTGLSLPSFNLVRVTDRPPFNFFFFLLFLALFISFFLEFLFFFHKFFKGIFVESSFQNCHLLQISVLRGWGYSGISAIERCEWS